MGGAAAPFQADWLKQSSGIGAANGRIEPIPLKKPSNFERGCELRLSFFGCNRVDPGFSSCVRCRWLEFGQFAEFFGRWLRG
jgi:hypothetical protein